MTGVRALLLATPLLAACAVAADEDPTVTDQAAHEVSVTTASPYVWVTSAFGAIPPGSFVAGTDGGLPLCACRYDDHNGWLHLGKTRPGLGGCRYELNGIETNAASGYEVLKAPVDAMPTWRPATNGVIPVGASPEGHSSAGNTFYLCRAQYSGVQVGRLVAGTTGCTFSYAGGKRTVSTYEVLIRRWVDDTAGNVPDGSTPVANEAPPGSEPLYACRTPYDNGLHLGKIRPFMGGCQFEFAGGSVWNNVYQVVTYGNDASYGNPESPIWQGGSYGSVPADAAPVGYERSGAPLYLCRASYNGGRQLGKVRPGFWGCNFAMGGFSIGTGVTVPIYEVLMRPEITILPLGDSVTWGVGGTNAGYRAGLASLLSAAGRSFRFVGTSIDNPGQLPANQRHHEGHSGFVITAGTSGRQGISDNIANWLGAQGVHPDVVLLMIGTNDVDLNYDLGHAGDRLSALIGAIANKNTGLAPTARLVVAKITPINDPAEDGRAFDYNTAVATAVLQHASRGENVRLVDMHGALTTSDLSDKLHPNDSGYAKMAHVWLDAIAAP